VIFMVFLIKVVELIMSFLLIRQIVFCLFPDAFLSKGAVPESVTGLVPDDGAKVCLEWKAAVTGMFQMMPQMLHSL